MGPPEIVKDEQWESNNPKLKGKSCNVVSLTTVDNVMTLASFSNSKEEKLVLGTRSEKQYLRQYN